MPDGLLPKYWDATTGAVQVEPLVKDFAELATSHQAETERKAALAARKPEDIKFEVKLPDTVKVPLGADGKPLAIGINKDDPRIPVIRDLAIKNGWDQGTVDALVALDAEQQIQNHFAEQARVAAEDKKLGEKAPERKAAIGNWLKGATERGVFTAEESKALSEYAIDAPTITAFEKLIAQANGSVPGNTDTSRQPKPADVPIWERFYPEKQKVG